MEPSTPVDCGPFVIEFMKSDDTPLEVDLFQDQRASDKNQFTVKYTESLDFVGDTEV